MASIPRYSEPEIPMSSPGFRRSLFFGGPPDQTKPPSITGNNPVPSAIPPTNQFAAARTPSASQPVGRYYLPGLGPTYLDPDFADRVSAFLVKAQADGLSPTFSSGYRDTQRQAALRDDSAAITPARRSLHSTGQAVDINISALTPAQQAKLIADAAAAGINWGGNFRRPDRPHFYVDPGGDRQQRINAFGAAVQALKDKPPDD